MRDMIDIDLVVFFEIGTDVLANFSNRIVLISRF